VKTLKDPIHGNIHFPDDEIGILDSKEFQRLRNIKQLGLSYLVYPSATHTRFEHSVGAYFLAGKLAENIGFSKDDSQLIRLSALLHDIGHGPFSHSSEHAILTRFDSKYSHEKNTADILKKSAVAGHLKKIGFSSTEISKVAVEGKSKFSDIISGEIDVDRMDYLVRDSYYTGAAYGVIDLDRLLDTLKFKSGHLYLSEKGITLGESFVLARYLMYPTVYEHHTTRIGDSMFSCAIYLALKEGLFTPEEMYRMDDIEFISQLRGAGGLCTKLVDEIESRQLYKTAIRLSKEELGKSFGRLIKLNPKQVIKLEKELLEETGLSEGEALLDIPEPLYSGEAKAKILDNGKIKMLSDVSPLVRALGAAQWSHWNIAVYCEKENVEKVKRAAKRILL